MDKEDVERFAFLYLCGKQDKNILTGKEKMRFFDFNRLTYITDFLGFTYFNLSLWSEYSGQFKEEFSAMDKLVMEHAQGFDFDEYEYEIEQQEKWLEDFCRNAPNNTIRKELREIVQRIYAEMDAEE